MTDLFHWLSIVNWPGALIVVIDPRRTNTNNPNRAPCDVKKTPDNKKPTPKNWPKCLILLVGIESGSTPAMKHSPHTRAQLRAIQDRNRANPDAMTLLREIKRLHGILNNAWQVFDYLPPEPDGTALARLIGLVNNEPRVKEQRAMYERVSGNDGRKPNG